MATRIDASAWVAAAVGLALGTLAAAQTGTQQPPALPTRIPMHRPPAEPVKPNGDAPQTPSPAGPQLRESTIPGLEDADFLIRASPLRSEGTFLVERRGSIVRLQTGERVMVFFEDDEGKRERPMVLIPCQRLQQMEQMTVDQPTVFEVTGQVFAYGSVNYFLPTIVRQVGQTRAAAPASQAVRPTENDAGVQDLIRQLETQRDAPRGPEAKSADAKSDPAQAEALPEGQALVRRRGRLVRLPSGDWAMTFDSGTSGESRTDRPLTLAPCLNLQRMEAWAMRSGDSATFEVSGRLLAYEGRNYLIPTMFQVYPTTELEARH